MHENTLTMSILIVWGQYLYLPLGHVQPFLYILILMIRKSFKEWWFPSSFVLFILSSIYYQHCPAHLCWINVFISWIWMFDIFFNLCLRIFFFKIFIIPITFVNIGCHLSRWGECHWFIHHAPKVFKVSDTFRNTKSVVGIFISSLLLSVKLSRSPEVEWLGKTFLDDLYTKSMDLTKLCFLLYWSLVTETIPCHRDYRKSLQSKSLKKVKVFFFCFLLIHCWPITDCLLILL